MPNHSHALASVPISGISVSGSAKLSGAATSLAGGHSHGSYTSIYRSASATTGNYSDLWGRVQDYGKTPLTIEGVPDHSHQISGNVDVKMTGTVSGTISGNTSAAGTGQPVDI